MKVLARRGSALIITLVVMGVLAVMAVGAITFSGAERVSAFGLSRSTEVRACAEAARAYLIANLRQGQNATSPPQPTEIRFADRALGSGDEEVMMHTGHYNEHGAAPTVLGAQLLGPNSGLGGRAGTARDITNLAGVNHSQGGQYYRVVVHCQSQGKQHEIEFVIRQAGL